MTVKYNNYPREKTAYSWIGDREINLLRVEGAPAPGSAGFRPEDYYNQRGQHRIVFSQQIVIN